MLTKKTDTAEAAEFWAVVARVRDGINEWPEWKRRLLENDPPLARPMTGDDGTARVKTGDQK